MASSCSFSLPEYTMAYDQKKVMIIDELEQGRELATQLRDLLIGVGSGEMSYAETETSARDLTSKMMESFTNGLVLLDKNDSVKSFTSSSPAESDKCLDGRKLEDSEEISCRNDSSSVKAKDRRGSYKRRKSSNSWRRETPNLIDDGHAWRKYGQKLIHNSEYPRNYYRCTHKYEQKCQATKHVQKIQDQPPMYRTTYYTHHTCRNLVTGPELIFDCPSPTGNSSFLLSFDTTNNDVKFPETKHPFFPPLNYVKREFGDDQISATLDAHRYSENETNEPHFRPVGHSSNLLSDIHGDVNSGVTDLDLFDDDVMRLLGFL